MPMTYYADTVLGDFQWYRQLRGGHWEEWEIWVFPPDEWALASAHWEWHRMPGCSRVRPGAVPEGAIAQAEGPRCEEYAGHWH